MSLHKRFFVFFILLSFIFLGKQLILQGAFLCVRTYVHVFKGWHISVDSLRWQGSTIVVENGSWTSGSNISVFAPKTIISLQGRHLSLENPCIHVSKIEDVGEGVSFPWNISIVNGDLECLGWSFLGLSLETNEERASGSFLLKDRVSRFSFDVELKEKSCWTLSLENVDIASFGQPWSSCIQGKVTATKNEKGMFLSQCHLDVSHLSYLDLLQDVSLSLDWEGSFEKIFSSFDADSLLKAVLDGSSRINILQGKVCLNHSQICDLKGDFGVHGSLGAQWDVFGKVGVETIFFSGKGVYQSCEKSWMESLIRYGTSSFSLQAKEENARYVSDLQVHLAIQEDMRIFQDAAQRIAAKWGNSFVRSCVFHEGVMDGSFRLIWDKGSIVSWNVLDFDIKDVRIATDQGSFFCERALFKEGMYCLNGGKFLCEEMEVLWRAEGNEAKKEGRFSLASNGWQVAGDFVGDISSFQGSCSTVGDIEGEFLFSGKIGDRLSFFVDRGKFSLFPFSLSEFSMEMEANLEKISLYHVKGLLDVGSVFFLYCPILESDGVFDVRLERETLNLLRLVGHSKEGFFNVDVDRSHCFGNFVSCGFLLWTKEGVQSAHLQFDLLKTSLDSVFSPFILKIKESLGQFAVDRDLESLFVFRSDVVCKIDYNRLNGTDVLLRNPLEDHVFLHGTYRDSVWQLHQFEFCDFSFCGNLMISKKGICLTEGKGQWGDRFTCTATARFASLSDWDVHLDAIELDARALSTWISEGKIQGEGVVRCQGDIQADFDFVSSSIHTSEWCFENQEPLHVMVHSKQGFFVRGMNVLFIHPQSDLSCLHCKVGLVHCDFQDSTWKLDDCWCQSNVMGFQHLSSFDRFPFPLKSFILSLKKDVHCIADIRSSFDFSSVSCFMKEGLIPIQDDVYHVQNLNLNADEKECRLRCEVAHGPLWIYVEGVVCFGDVYRGSLTIQRELTIEVFFDDSLHIQSIEGRFFGMEMSFREESDILIGRSDVDCHVLSQFLSPPIVKVFEELKMGDGYELMGRMRLNPKGFYFQGVLSGKQVELFGFQFKTLLAQIDISPEHVLISDLKVSDFAGTMTIPYMEAKGIGDNPWTISIPHLTIAELRPSLLQEVGKKTTRPANPLVIRQLKLENFHGLVDDSKTYLAKGELYFINSYKRGASILELPSNLLSRIVGLDLDLLVPVRGTLKYELKNGKFHLTELANAYSENQRSEFFLVYGEDCPTVDLDWNVNILIKMKQFVLFKFTEAFLISVTGKLGDPEFHLQSKKRFFGFDL